MAPPEALDGEAPGALHDPVATDAAESAVPAGPDAVARRRDPRWVWPAVLAIAALAGVAYGWAVNRVGVEMYYAGAVRTMAHDWHAFLFGGFDAAGTVTLDKLPGAFWIQALVVRVFGMSTVSLVAPQVAAGILAVVALFRAVRRIAGPRAGVVAAAILAGTPAAAVASRGNTADGVCTLLLILAADATVRAVRNGRVRSVLLAAGYVGLAFQVKMVEAWAILPGLAAAYLIAAPGTARRRLAVGGLGAGVLVAVSLSWMTAVSLVPAADRPYVDGSPGNSVFYQVFAYNGVNRFGSDTRAYGLGDDPPYAPSAAAVAYAELAGPGAAPVADQSSPGALRLVTGPVGRDAGWLLPAAFVALFGGLVSRIGRPRGDIVRAGLLVWGGWLAVFVIAFNRTPHLLTYYTGLLGPAVAALCAIGLRVAYRGLRAPAEGERRRRLVLTATVATTTVAGTVVVEALLTRSTPGWLSATTLAAGGAGLVVLLALVGAGAARRRFGLLAASAALLVAPVAALVGMVVDGGGSFDAPYPAGGTLAHPTPRPTPVVQRAGYGGVVVPTTGDALWQRLGRIGELWPAGNTLLVFASAQASVEVAAGVPGVVPIGGFTGLAPTPTVDQVRAMITGGTVTLAIVPGPLDIRANDPRVVLITTMCTPLVDDPAADVAGPVEYRCRG